MGVSRRRWMGRKEGSENTQTGRCAGVYEGRFFCRMTSSLFFSLPRHRDMFGGGDQMSVKEEASSSLFFIHPDIERVKNLLSVSLELLKTEIGLLDLDEKRKIALGEGLERLGQANGLLEHIISEHKEKEASEIQGKMEEICNTMYFYFSNSNLSKDRFLKREIERSEGGWIPLSLFTSSFNKIKSMTQNPTLVSRSIRSKPRTTTEWSLEISDDGTAVRRSGDLPNFDSDLSLDTTIYCHNIPRNSTHESLSSLFSQFGSVVYVRFCLFICFLFFSFLFFSFLFFFLSFFLFLSFSFFFFLFFVCFL